MAHDVFICYSSKDKTTADMVCAVLESEGIRCWIAPRDILVGMSYGEAIVDAIHHAKALVLVFSGHANASPQIEREVERAINHRIPVVPLRIEDVAPDKALEYFLSTPHWLDAFTPPLDRHLRNLAGQIRRLIKADGPDQAARDAAAAAVGSPFKTPQAGEEQPAAVVSTPPVVPAPPPPPKPETAPRAENPSNAPLGVGAFAAASSANPSASGGASVGSPPPPKAGSGSSPVDFFKKLDTPQMVGIGAAALALIIGVAWMLSGSGSGSNNPPPYQSGPGFSPVNVTDNKSGPSGGPGLPAADNSARTTPGPSGPSGPSSQSDNGVRGPAAPHMPDDGDVIPGRAPAPGPGAPRGPGDTATTSPTDGVYTAVTGGDIVGVLSEAGYDATALRDNQGDPMIQGTIEGFKFAIFFYRCDKQSTPETCLDLQFHSSFTNDAHVGDDKLNAYNRDNRFGQAYFQTNGEIGLDMSATLQGGVARQHIKEVIDWWKTTLVNFPKKMGAS